MLAQAQKLFNGVLNGNKKIRPKKKKNSLPHIHPSAIDNFIWLCCFNCWENMKGRKRLMLSCNKCVYHITNVHLFQDEIRTTIVTHLQDVRTPDTHIYICVFVFYFLMYNIKSVSLFFYIILLVFYIFFIYICTLFLSYNKKKYIFHKTYSKMN